MNKTTTLSFLLLILVALLVSSCSEISTITDPCKSEFEDCKYSCGEGILNKICKEKCTYDYNKCQEEKE